MLSNARKIGLSAAIAGLALMPMAGSAQVFGSNLVVNGDAETGSITPFTTTGSPSIVAYGTGGGFPGPGDPGVSQGGTYFFAGGGDSPSTASQMFDVTGGASAIDLGTSGYTLSALLGGYADQGDNAVLSIDFLNGLNTSLGMASIGPVTQFDRNSQTGLLSRSTMGFIPIGTRSIDLTLTLTRLNGGYNDGYADNLSLVLTPGEAVVGSVPEPASWAMLITGFGLMGAGLRYRRKRMVLRYV